jgi:hypothetical protein
MQGRLILPLYSEAVKFFHHEEAMVRIAVRTITLNVYSGKLVIYIHCELGFVASKTTVFLKKILVMLGTSPSQEPHCSLWLWLQTKKP